MIGRDEIKEEISLVPHSQVLGHHEPDKSISTYDNSLMMEKSGVIPSDEIRGESSVTSHIRKWNLRRRRRRFPSSSHRRFGRDILPCFVRSDGSNAKEQSMKSTLLPCYKFFNYLNPSLFGLVAAKYQGKSEDPFKSNPAPSWSSLAAIVMHFLISLILMQFHSRLTRFLPFLSRVVFASGVVSSLSLISLLLPKSPGLLLICASWALFVVISWWPTLESTYDWLLTKIKTVIDVVISFAKNLFTGENTNSQQGFIGENTNSQQERPPV